jgi:hypothetical protein
MTREDLLTTYHQYKKNYLEVMGWEATIHDLLSPKLYEGTQIFALREQGIELKAVSEEWNEVIAYLSRL